MPIPGLKEIQQRWERRGLFFAHLLTQVCQQCVAVLRETTPGQTLPQEWQYEVKASGTQATARVFTTRLDRTDADWELILTFLDLGTRDHGPVKAKVLHWVDKDTGEDVFRPWVRGITASNFRAKTDRVIQAFETTIPRKWQTYMNTGKMT